MNLDDLILVSIDDHVSEPADMFKNHLPRQLQSKAPKLVTLDDGTDRWVYEDYSTANVGLNAVVGRPKEEYGFEPQSYAEIRKANYDIQSRIDDMNANGVLGSLCFGTLAGFAGDMFSKHGDRKTSLRMIQAYNDWHIDEWAGTYPGRIIPLAILPLWSGEAAADEVRRVVKKGCRAISFLDNPAARNFPSVHDSEWEPLWKVCNDEHVVINCHIGTGSEPPHASDLSPMNAWITAMPMSIANAAADWLHMAALQRYPKLKIALSEGGIGWVPYFLERVQFTYEHHVWTHVDFAGKSPSEVFREHFITCFISDEFGLRNYEDIGEDIITYECDYPHSDCTWPYSPEQIWEQVKDLPKSVIQKVTHRNVMREYNYDPFSILGRENCTVRALRAQAEHVDTEPKSTPGFNPDVGNGVVTSGDVMKAFAQTPVAKTAVEPEVRAG